MTRLPAGSLVITTGKDGQPHYEGKWRHQGRQIKRRLGPAWLKRGEAVPGASSAIDIGKPWIKRPGRPQEGFLSERDAHAALTALIKAHAAENAQGRTHEAAPTFADAAERWYERAVRRQRKPATLFSYRQGIDRYILGTEPTKRIKTVCPFAQKPISEVGKSDMQNWFNSLEHSRTKEKLLKFVKGICALAVAEEWMSVNVANAVECQSIPYDRSYDFYSVAEIKRLIAAAADDHDAAIFATAALAGLRKGELIALMWRDVDFRHSRIRVGRNLSHDQLSTPKNGQLRTVPLVPVLAARLKLLKHRQHATARDYVFANPRRSVNDNPWPHPRALERRYKTAITTAGLRRLPFHSLRHHFASQAINVATLTKLQQWLGHADVRMTSRYTHAKALDSDAELLALAFST